MLNIIRPQFWILFVLATSFSYRAFAQDTLCSEIPAPGSSAPVQVVPADPDLMPQPSTPYSSPSSAPTMTMPLQSPSFNQSPSASQTIRSRDVSGGGSAADGVLSVLNVNEGNRYNSNLEMREQRKIGLGAGFGGDVGMFGWRAEYNFEDADGAVVGLGWGPGYQAFSLNWKHNWESFLDTELSPFIKAGYAHWAHTGGGNYSQSDILKQALNDEQKETRRFGVDFIPVFVGLQYYFLEAEYAGLTFQAEIGLLNQINPTRQMIITGGVGSTFYF